MPFKSELLIRDAYNNVDLYALKDGELIQIIYVPKGLIDDSLEIKVKDILKSRFVELSMAKPNMILLHKNLVDEIAFIPANSIKSNKWYNKKCDVVIINVKNSESREIILFDTGNKNASDFVMWLEDAIGWYDDKKENKSGDRNGKK